ncbi:methyl-accepting chemotaxis protein [Thalassospira sp.]|uniref:methyl-accepting chemotaxis protein n=1 Tax=Thalassospira sp. TaxID=1912094 RepID=UPI002733C7C9|nr:methyl-accepting chemotaxis protein [Thalassospira sp.]MDP2697498.1 methyl-accepting chemotaxis protein [Thalassospira sp.]
MFAAFIRSVSPEDDIRPVAANGSDLASALRLLRHVSDIVDEAPDATSAMARILDAVCGHCQWPVGHAYLRHVGAGEGGGDQLQSAKIWSIGQGIVRDDLRAFCDQSEATRFEIGQGLIGGVAQSGQAVCLDDVTTKAGFLRADGARRNGLRGCFALPVRLDGQVVAVVEFFSRAVASLDAQMLELLGFVGGQVARALERDGVRESRRRLAQDFDLQVQGTVGQLAAAVSQMRGALGVLEQGNARTRDSSEGIDRAAVAALARIENVAREMEGLRTTLESVGRDAGDNLETTDRLGQQASRIRDDFGALQDRASDAGRMLKTISDIASQIKLLGLNASIEAARVGEAGRGFAIVAKEVKALADDSEHATRDIALWMDSVTGAIAGAASAVDSMAHAMTGLQDNARQTANQTAQQLGNCQQISNDVAGAVADARHVSDQVTLIRTAIADGEGVLQDVAAAARVLDDQGRDLSQRVDGFVGSITRI